MERTRSLANHLREIQINAVNSGVDKVSISVNLLDEIINRFDIVDGKLYDRRNTLNMAILPKEVEENE